MQEARLQAGRSADCQQLNYCTREDGMAPGSATAPCRVRSTCAAPGSYDVSDSLRWEPDRLKGSSRPDDLTPRLAVRAGYNVVS